MEKTINFLSDNDSRTAMRKQVGQWHGDGVGGIAWRWSGGNGMEMDWGEWH